MDFVVTLICDPVAMTIDGTTCAAASDALKNAEMAVTGTDFLAPGIACDIFFRANGPPEIVTARAEESVRLVLTHNLVDVVVQLQQGRRKRFLAADMESTIIVNEMLNELAALVDGDGKMEKQISRITARAMRGDVDFSAALRERVALLEGCPCTLVEKAKSRISFMPGAVSLVRTMRRDGAFTLLLSGGFSPFTEYVAAAAGFDQVTGNTLEVRNGRLTGRVIDPLFDSSGKLETLRRVALEKGVSLSETMAVGDGVNDIPMLKAAGTGVAFHAKPVAAEVAQVRIGHGDLTALLYLQGYRSEEIVI